MAERTEYEFVLTDLKGYEVTGQHIKVRGIFAPDTACLFAGTGKSAAGLSL